MINYTENIGTAKDNYKAPFHRWFKFTAGFSFKFIEEIIRTEKLKSKHIIFDPFAGCGTTLVTAQENGIPAIGNEANSFLYEVISAKVNWKINKETIDNHINNITLSESKNLQEEYPLDEHKLLFSLYHESSIRKLSHIKKYIRQISDDRESHLFLKLALSQTLFKTSNYPISIPYISRNKFTYNTNDVTDVFVKNVNIMLNDIKLLKSTKRTSQIYLQDSRLQNDKINDKTIDICITSPPYLNNLDYGEVSKVHTYFYEITKDWKDITNKIRKNLITASTTHFTDKQFDILQWKQNEFFLNNKSLAEELILKSNEMKEICINRPGKKRFDIMLLLYFQDMYFVLKEIKRVLKNGNKAYLILGDSAPYGVFIPTTELLGKIGLNIGFKEYEIIKIRTRGTKWKTLKNRHKIDLTENLLILR